MLRKFVKLIRTQQRVCFYINYVQKNPSTKFNDEFQATINQDGKLVPNIDHSIISDHDDKFGLSQIRDPAKILTHLKSVDFKYSFNDLTYFLKHLVHISEEHQLRAQIINNYNFKEFLNHIKKCLFTQQTGKFPLIGSYAYCFKQLEINDQELWKLLEHKILEDEYHTTFAESVYAAQGFTKLPLIYFGKSEEYIQERLDKLYKKLERVIRITIWEVNPIHYHSIVMSLTQVNRFDPEMFGKLEQHILTNLSLNYTTKMMVDILFAFSKGKQGSLEFYDSMQYVIFKGHMFNRNYFLQSLSELSYDGHLVAGLLGVYKEAQDKYHEFQLHPDFQNKVHNLMTNKLTYYDLDSLTQTLQLLPTFIKDDYRNIQASLIKKVNLMKGQFQIQDILSFYKFIESNYESIQQAPLEQMNYVEENLYKYSDQVSMDDLIVILQYLYERPKFIQQPDKFIAQVVKSFDQNINFMTAAQIDQFTNLFQPFLEFQQKQLGQSGEITNTLRKLKDVQLIKSYYQKQLD